jgi:hypothetical protein
MGVIKTVKIKNNKTDETAKQQNCKNYSNIRTVKISK